MSSPVKHCGKLKVSLDEKFDKFLKLGMKGVRCSILSKTCQWKRLSKLLSTEAGTGAVFQVSCVEQVWKIQGL